MKPKKMKKYREDEPTDPGMTLDKLPEKIPAEKKTSVPGEHGSGTKEGLAQELRKYLKKSDK